MGLIVFLLAVILVWIVPGLLILKYFGAKLGALSEFCLAFGLGFCLWGLQAYTLGYLNLRILTYGYTAILFVLLLLNQKFLLQRLSEFVRELFKLDKLLLLMLAVGVVIQYLQMVGTGLSGNLGMPFFRVHMQDGIYHLSMIASMVRAFPPQEPGAAGVMVQNYHYWSDLIFADLSRVFRLPINSLFFQFLPPVLSFFTGLAVIALLKSWTKRKSVWFFGLFILFFGADLGYLIAYLIHGVFSFQYPVIDNGATQFLNMPHVAAKLIFFTSLSSLTIWMKEVKWKWGAITLFLTAVLFGLKIYFALYAILGLAVVLIFTLLKRRFEFVKQLMVCGMIGAILALAIYLPPNHSSGGLGFYPLEWSKLMLAADNLDWRDWRYKIAIAEYEKSNLKIALYDLEAIAVTLLAIHGTRILGLFWTKKTGKEIGFTWIAYLVVPSLIFTFLGLYTLQVSGAFNVFNFFAASLAPMGILAAFFFADLWGINRFAKVLVVVLVLITLPRIIFETQKIINSYMVGSDVLYISKSEISALEYIKTNYSASCVISSSYNNEVDMNTPYVGYFSNHFTYMSGQRVLETHNAPTQARYDEFKANFSGNSGERVAAFLKSKHICALYLKSQDVLREYFVKHEKIVFQNDEAVVVDLR